MIFQYNDGGRVEAGYKGNTDDCVCRSISIATEKPYQEVYDLIKEFGSRERISKRKKSKSHPRTGVYPKTTRKIMEYLGWKWVPTMLIGQGCKVHLKDGELPKDSPLIIEVSKHTTAIVNGVIHDTHNPSRNGSRCVYGYYRNGEESG